jgi:histidinol dehydrogenase
MLGIPAKIAGCREIVLCTPSNKEGEINPTILYTANLVGIKTIYKIGGAQAIAGLTYGTESVLKVDKIFGPGNQYVTKAKELAQQDGVAIDMPAGPSEVLVIADATSNPRFVAADLLSQAEHGADSQVILVSDNDAIISASLIEIEKQLANLPRNEIAKKALKNSKAILFSSIEECVTFSNEYAPEHLIFATDNAENYLDDIINAGSVFIGNYSCESAGDYASGTNHTLPTNGYAKNYSGVSLDSFVKKITFQKLSEEGIKGIGNAIELMAEAEGLFAHKNAVTLRLKEINDV